MTSVLLGFQIADPLINWPASVEADLCDRDGWERRIIPVLDLGMPSSMLAMCRGQLAVNRMLGDETGFAICLAGTGCRITYGGRVFARCTDAMVAAERLMAADDEWPSSNRNDFSSRQQEALRLVFLQAEQRGEILRDLVMCAW